MLIKWEARDPQTYLLWTTMNNWVYAGFDVTYKKMGVSFDKLYYESETFLLGKDQVIEGLKSGVFFKKEVGSVWIDLTLEGLDEKLVLRTDGTAVYMTQDIGTAIDRFNDYKHLSGMVYTVGNEQDYHFKVLFLILQKLGYSWAKNCFHLSYGMVDLPSGKMKSREGTVVDADDLMAEVVEKATELTKERGHLDGLSESDRNLLYERIGMGGLKYYLLKVDPKKRMLFNPEESVEFEGDACPYIQYNHARIKTILRRAESENIGFEIKDFQNYLDWHATEHELLQLLLQFPNVIAEASKTYSPYLVAQFCYEIAKMYSKFFFDCSIFKADSEESRAFRLALSALTGNILKKAMLLLGIDVPEMM
jgi:arginyl-tRNA synthetase